MLEDAWAGRILFFRRYEALSSEALFFRRYDASARKSQDKIDFFMPGALAVQFPFFFFGSWHPQCYCGALAVQFPFFFFGSCHLTLSHWAFMAQWPDGVWKKTPGLFFFWFLGQCPSQCVQTKKKNKNKKKSCKKKVLLYKY
jgi:hypothetical protein